MKFVVMFLALLAPAVYADSLIEPVDINPDAEITTDNSETEHTYSANAGYKMTWADRMEFNSYSHLRKSKTYSARAKAIAYDLEHGRFAQRTQAALSMLIKVAANHLYKRGFKTESQKLMNDWNGRYRNVINSWGIGDYPALNAWLTTVYEMLEAKLGYSTCQALHLTDIKTFNYAPTVVFNACTYSLEDFEDHFTGDGKYYGLAPVVSFWLSYGICVAGTGGIGAAVACGAAATGIEYVMYNMICPKIDDQIYAIKCGN